jgi:hypothetical protein
MADWFIKVLEDFREKPPVDDGFSLTPLFPPLPQIRSMHNVCHHSMRWGWQQKMPPQERDDASVHVWQHRSIKALGVGQQVLACAVQKLHGRHGREHDAVPCLGQVGNAFTRGACSGHGFAMPAGCQP